MVLKYIRYNGITLSATVNGLSEVKKSDFKPMK
jgi:hypothetical protein